MRGFLFRVLPSGFKRHHVFLSLFPGFALPRFVQRRGRWHCKCFFENKLKMFTLVCCVFWDTSIGDNTVKNTEQSYNSPIAGARSQAKSTGPWISIAFFPVASFISAAPMCTKQSECSTQELSKNETGVQKYSCQYPLSKNIH